MTETYLLSIVIMWLLFKTCLEQPVVRGLSCKVNIFMLKSLKWENVMLYFIWRVSLNILGFWCLDKTRNVACIVCIIMSFNQLIAACVRYKTSRWPLFPLLVIHLSKWDINGWWSVVSSLWLSCLNNKHTLSLEFSPTDAFFIVKNYLCIYTCTKLWTSVYMVSSFMSYEQKRAVETNAVL